MARAHVPYRVLFVCTGNICRSAMAEGILKDRADDHGMNDLVVLSAGIAAMPGAPASQLAAETAMRNGITIYDHKARPVTPAILKQADLILTMSGSHYSWILDQDPMLVQKTFMLKEYGTRRVPADANIPDPYGGDEHVYQRSFATIADEIDRILPVLEKAIDNRKK